MTICMASICEELNNPTILLCADRLVSAGIQFEGGSSKIRVVTPNCYIMQSSNDSLISDSIYQRLIESLPHKESPIKKIVSVLAEECVKYKREKQEKDVLSNYNIANETLKSSPDLTIKDAISDLENYQYPTFEFIVCGIDSIDKVPYLFKIDQDGDTSNWNFLGFAVTGSGSALAFAELTKRSYHVQLPFSAAMPRVYFAKRTSERAQGVGRFTDFGFLNLQIDPKDKDKTLVRFTPLSNDPGILPMFDGAYDKMIKDEDKTINDLQQQIDELIRKAQEETARKAQEETEKSNSS